MSRILVVVIIEDRSMELREGDRERKIQREGREGESVCVCEREREGGGRERVCVCVCKTCTHVRYFPIMCRCVHKLPALSDR